jgi:hypothetical protein
MHVQGTVLDDGTKIYEFSEPDGSYRTTCHEPPSVVPHLKDTTTLNVLKAVTLSNTIDKTWDQLSSTKDKTAFEAAQANLCWDYGNGALTRDKYNEAMDRLRAVYSRQFGEQLPPAGPPVTKPDSSGTPPSQSTGPAVATEPPTALVVAPRGPRDTSGFWCFSYTDDNQELISPCDELEQGCIQAQHPVKYLGPTMCARRPSAYCKRAVDTSVLCWLERKNCTGAACVEATSIADARSQLP